MKRIEWNAENHTAIVHPGSENRSLSKIEIQIEHGKEPQINFEPITLWLEKYPEDPKIKVMVDQLLEKDKASLNQIIGYSDFDLNRGITGGDSPEGSFVADSMREFSRSDFAFINAGGIRHPIRKGPITMEDLYLLQPFDNQAEVLQLSGEQIRALIEMSLSVEFKQINKDDDAYHLDNFKVRAKGLKRVFQGKFGYLIPSGLHFEFDPQLPPMNRISVLSDSKGSALIPKNLYKVAVASYMSRGGDGYTFLKEIKPILTTPNYIRDMVLEKIIKDGGIKKLPETRILNKRLEVSFLD
ncbi:5'-nucleotidase C-terminal domain-containing protein [bacterium]|nr:5'-nucleotidase C-terminal domain-containing protein [bacterium]